MFQIKVFDLGNITKFAETYFHVWKYNMKLTSKSKLIIVKGLEIEPISPPTSPNHLPIT
jgi:hypothetical protein